MRALRRLIPALVDIVGARIARPLILDTLNQIAINLLPGIVSFFRRGGANMRDADTREKVLSKLIFWEHIIWALITSICCVLLIERYFVPGTLEPSAGFGLASVFFLCWLGITKCAALRKNGAGAL